MWKSVDLTKIDKLLEEYKDYKHSGESFSSFIETTNDDEIPVWDWTDSIGIVTHGDFENHFSGKYIEKNFEKLANMWFSCSNSQIDWGITLDSIKDEINWEKKDGRNAKKN